MTEKYIKILEFDKILQMACEYAVCPAAKELMLIQPPACNAEEERAALEQTDCITSLLLKSTPRFYKVQDSDKAYRRACKGGILSMSELICVANTLRNYRMLSAWYNGEEHGALITDDYFYMLRPNLHLEKSILDAILSESEMADTASDTLYSIRKKIRDTQSSIREKLDKIIKGQSTNKFLQDAVVSMRNGRYVVPVKAENRSEIQGVIHDVSQSGNTYFVEPSAVVQANAKIMQLQSAEQSEIERILQGFTDGVAAMGEEFLLAFDAMLQIDILLAKAQLALNQKASRPLVRDKAGFSLIKARHPLIDAKVVVPVDIMLGGATDTMIITGPNTGGKTVTLKTAGLLCCMAQHGFLIPAHDSSEVCAFSDILADIGDEQSIEQSLSTFSGHIKNIKDIFKLASEDTLVLMDELGAGTDPAEGAALAIAIIEELRSKNALVLATTHYAELKIFALETKGVQNACCEFDTETLRPTYKICVGIPGKSNAFLISQKLGLPEKVIRFAENHLSAEDRQFDTVLSQLDELKDELRQKQEEIEQLKHGAENELVKAKEKCEKLIAQGELELAGAREKAKNMAESVQSEAFRLMDEMRKLEKEDKRDAAYKAVRAREIARKDSEKLINNTDVVHISNTNYEPLQSVTIGQEVFINDIGKTGIVSQLPDRKGLVQVRSGVLMTKVQLSGLSVPQQMAKSKAAKNLPRTVKSASFTEKVVRTAQMEINLIGLNCEEAIMETDRFIDGAVMNGQNTIYIIHGKGAGILRKAIHSHLRTHKSIRTFRIGTFGEGEAGVTVAELK